MEKTLLEFVDKESKECLRDVKQGLQNEFSKADHLDEKSNLLEGASQIFGVPKSRMPLPVVDSDVSKLLQDMVNDSGTFRYFLLKTMNKRILVESAVTQSQLEIGGSDYANASKAAYERIVLELRKRPGNMSECRHVVYNFKFTTRVGAETLNMDKIVLLKICPVGASEEQKAECESAAAAIVSSQSHQKGIFEHQISGEPGMTHEEFVRKMEKKIGVQIVQRNS